MRNPSDIFGNGLFQRGKKYESVYNTLVQQKKLFDSMQQLFFLAASIGFKKKTKEEFEKGIDMRQEHLGDDSLAIFYTMFINEHDNLDLLNDKDVLRQYLKNDVVEYAEGGMKILCERVFTNTWDKNELVLRQDYDYYLEDIMTFVKSEIEEPDF